MHKDINVNVSGPVQPASTYKTKVLKGQVPFDAQVTEPNMKYVIKHNFDLGGESVTISEGCLLEFDGGAISNGTLVGQSTILIYNQPLNDILTVTLEGTWRHESGVKADEEDIADLNGELKFKDKAYAPANYSGLGRKYLRKNLVNGVNTLTQSMINATNTIYIIQYDYDLGDATITIPANSVLEFDGGSLSNGTLVGDETYIVDDSNELLFDSIHISGDWKCPQIYARWFKNATDNDVLKDVFNLQSDDVNEIYLDNKVYKVSVPQNPYNPVLKLKKNTTLYNGGAIALLSNNATNYHIIEIKDVENVKIIGGTIIGDKETHTGTTGEWGMGIAMENCIHVVIQNVKIEKCWGDGIYMGSESTAPSNIVQKVIIENFWVTNCRRQGISITNARDIVIRNGIIENIFGTAPESCIDLEPNGNTLQTSNIVIDNIIFNNEFCLDSWSWSMGANKRIRNITVRNCRFTCTCAISFLYVSGLIVENNYIVKNTTPYNTDNPNRDDYLLHIESCEDVNIDNNRIDDSQGGEGAMVVNWKDVTNGRFSNTNIATANSTVFKHNCPLVLENITCSNPWHSFISSVDNAPIRATNCVISCYSLTVYAGSILKDNTIVLKSALDCTSGFYINNEITFKMANFGGSAIIKNNRFTSVANFSGEYINMTGSNVILDSNKFNISHSFSKIIANNNNNRNKITNNHFVLTVSPTDYVLFFIYETNNCTVINNSYEGTLSVPFVNSNVYYGNIYKSLQKNVGSNSQRENVDKRLINTGFDYFDTTNKYPAWWSGSKFVDANGFTSTPRKGDTASRPEGKHTSGQYTIGVLESNDIGFEYFDTTLGKPIYAKSIDNTTGVVTWVDATGATV